MRGQPTNTNGQHSNGPPHSPLAPATHGRVNGINGRASGGVHSNGNGSNGNNSTGVSAASKIRIDPGILLSNRMEAWTILSVRLTLEIEQRSLE